MSSQLGRATLMLMEENNLGVFLFPPTPRGTKDLNVIFSPRRLGGAVSLSVLNG